MDDLYSVKGRDWSKPEGTGDGADLTFTITRTGSLTHSGSVDWFLSPWAQNPTNAADFEPGTATSGTVQFAPGQSTAEITIKVAGDATYEQLEGFNFVLSNPVDGRLIGEPWSEGTWANGFVRNDDDTNEVPSPVAAHYGAVLSGVRSDKRRDGYERRSRGAGADLKKKITGTWSVAQSG